MVCWAIGYKRLESGKWRWTIYNNDGGFWEDLAYGEKYTKYGAFAAASSYLSEIEKEVWEAEHPHISDVDFSDGYNDAQENYHG